MRATSTATGESTSSTRSRWRGRSSAAARCGRSGTSTATTPSIAPTSTSAPTGRRSCGDERANGAAMRLFLALLLTLAAAPPAGPRFRTIPVTVESATPLAAYQVEITTAGRIVGVEGGDAPFDAPPYYDPAALAGGRVIPAALSTERALAAVGGRVALAHRVGGRAPRVGGPRTAAAPAG